MNFSRHFSNVTTVIYYQLKEVFIGEDMSRLIPAIILVITTISINLNI